MKQNILEILRCPRCFSQLTLSVFAKDECEVRQGRLTCENRHIYDIEDGIIRFATGFDHEAVKRELEYENSTYKGSDRLRDEKLIAQFPETLAELWPHTCHFGPDFKVLIDHLNPRPGQWVLDIGTGPCWSSRLLAQRGANVIALDVNEANFYGLKTSDILFEHHGVYFERILESMNNLPFENESLDFITFNASFHHTPDHEQTLRECQRVLKPDGVIAMVNEEFVSLRHRIFPPGEASDTGSHHAIAYSEFENAVKRNGFRAEYFVAEHVRQKLAAKIPEAPAKLAVGLFEIFPAFLKQLNSALVLLRKARVQQSRQQEPQPHTTLLKS